MKKALYSLFAVLILCCNFASCGDDDNDAAAPAGNPAASEAALGTYAGEWTVTLGDQSVTTPGTLTFTTSETNFVANVAIVSQPVDMTVGTSKSSQSVNARSLTNIVFAGPSGKYFRYTNLSDGNGLGTNFCGDINDGKATCMFSVSKKVGRNRYTFNYRFVGQKN